MIHQMVYISASRTRDTAREAEAILQTSRVNNEALGLTGFLLFSEGSFFQVLEGPGDALETVFRKIERDDRHSQIIVLHRTETSERAFADWSMGGFHLHPDDPLADRIKSIARLDDVSRRATETESVLSILIQSFLKTSRV